MSLITLDGVTKRYATRAGQVNALDNVNLEILPGQFVVLRGPSGSGKTTLLMVIAGMLRPSAGTVTVAQQDMYALGQQARARFRACHIGFVFQMFHLVPYLNVAENVALAARVPGTANHRGHIPQLLDRFGLAGRATHKPGELSAGEKQRTAIARALLNQPKIILADEPTGNLDPNNADTVMKHLADFQRAGGTVIVATHGPVAESFATQVVSLREGKLDGVQAC